LGSGWNNEDSQSVGIEVNAGIPITLNPHTKLVLVENKEEEESDTAFAASALFNPDRTRASPTSDALLVLEVTMNYILS
jgi:hypothetical protein